ncbi:hypothetical protein EC968_007369 [Mortierella alpina]|nr:hypothetical protein EC968_007369 [Mortierella alpina]
MHKATAPRPAASTASPSQPVHGHGQSPTTLGLDSIDQEHADCSPCSRADNQPPPADSAQSPQHTTTTASALSSAPSVPSYTSPVDLPETISLVCSYLDLPGLAVATQLNRTWSSFSLPLLYREIHLNSRTFKLDSLELGLLRHGHLCQKLSAVRDVNHWCPRIVIALGRMPNLLDLEATWMNTDLLQALIHLQKLERLWIPRLQGSQSEDNPHFEPSFQGSKRIRELNMSDTSLMTDASLVNITKTCPYIEVLTVSGNGCLTHEGLIRWCEQLRLQSSAYRRASHSISRTLDSPCTAMTALTTVNFANCNRIQSEGFEALFERSHHLQHVNVMATPIEDGALRVLAKQNADLRSVVLNCCARISDHGLQNLLRTSRKLEAVSFLYCHRISVQVFFQVLWKCIGLKELQFSFNIGHKTLIENGLSTSGHQDSGLQEAHHVQGSDPESMISLLAPANGSSSSSSPHFHEPQLEFAIFGGPEEEDNESKGMGSEGAGAVSESMGGSDPFVDAARARSASVQEYRQRLILSQIYRQLERLTSLELLAVRDIHLPLDVRSGLARLGRLEQLEVLYLAGLDKPFGPAEVDWLTGATGTAAAVHEKQPLSPTDQSAFRRTSPLQGTHQILPSLKTLVFKGGFSLPRVLRQKLKFARPLLDLHRILVKDQAT